MSRVLCFGEILLRMSPSRDQSWIRNNNMPVYIGGAELNVATALAKWGVPVNYFTAVPDNYLSDSMLSFVSESGIGIGPVLKTGSRVGIYYLQQGTDLKHSAVIYDRAHSSFSSLKPGMTDWDRAFKDISIFHFSAISPALNENVAAVCNEAVQEAEKRNITVSVDLNYRSSLWKDERNASEVMDKLVSHCDIVMGNIWSADTLLNIPVDPNIHSQPSHSAYCEHARKTALAIQKKYPRCTLVANTFRFDTGENSINYFGTLDTPEKQYHSPSFTSTSIKDKVGSGDCFMAGLLYGKFTESDPQQAIDFAAKAAFMKMHEVGDTTKNSIEIIRSAILNHE
jgi:2-dehydro-3-deoxygluconokinase